MDTYEKKYKEVFEKAKKEYEGAVGSHCDAAEAVINILQGLFPQLRESEDERIRKQLVNICNEWLSGGHSARPCLNDVRWLKNLLEKQKESLHISETYKENADSFTNEDEKIRKEIIIYLDFAESHNLLRAADYEKKKGWVAYLEKQKDAFENGRQFGIMQEQARQELEWAGEKQKEQKEESSKPELKTPEWVFKGWDDEYMINTVIGRYSLHAEVVKKCGDTHDYYLSKSMENWLRNVVKPLILEKQKEQNHKDEECTDFTIYHPLKNGKGKYECIPYSFCGSLTSFSKNKDLIDFLRTCFYTKEECNEWIEQQKEQKCLNISAALEWLREHICNYMNSEYNEFHKCVEYDGSIDKERLINDFENAMQKEQKPVNLLDIMLSKDPHLPKQAVKYEQKPAEDKYQQELEATDRWQEGYEDGYNAASKPAEWSEKDEKNLELVTDCVYEFYPDPVMKYKLKNWLTQRLKSLRPQPHWKPSKEQEEPKYYQHFDPDC